MNAERQGEQRDVPAREAAIARLLLGARADWNPDVALRYLPIVRRISALGLARHVTDVGCGSVGIGPYLGLPFTGVDSVFKPPLHHHLRPVESSVLDTPFPARSRPCVVSVDMLEHLPPALRAPAIAELVRITGRVLFLAVPSGAAAEAHDAEMAVAYERSRGAPFQYLREHVEYGLPTPGELEGQLQAAVAAEGRTADVTLVPNANLRLRSFVVRRWIRRGVLDKAAWVGLIWLSPLLARFHGEPAYRQLAVVTFRD